MATEGFCAHESDSVEPQPLRLPLGATTHVSRGQPQGLRPYETCKGPPLTDNDNGHGFRTNNITTRFL
jgi:hypothetical protein